MRGKIQTVTTIPGIGVCVTKINQATPGIIGSNATQNSNVTAE